MITLAAALLAAGAAATLEVRPAEARPGDAVLLVVTGAEAPPRARLLGREVRFWRGPDGWRALAALPVEAPVGPLRIEAEAAGGGAATSLEVVDPRFRERKLTVAPRFVKPPASVRARIAADRRAFAGAFDRPFGPPDFEGPFDRPLAAEMTGLFGDRRVFNGRQQSQHYGLDLDAQPGTPVHAGNEGVVVMVRDNYYAGLTVLVAHGADLFSAYFHLARADVKVGQRVARGEPIGRSGASGRATGPHLHWGIKVGGRWVDPESVLRLGAIGG